MGSAVDPEFSVGWCTVMKLPSPKWGGGKFITIKTSRVGLFGTCLQVWKTYPPHEISTSIPLPLLSILKRQHPPHSLLKSYSPLEKCPTINARAATLPLLYSVNIKGILLSSHPSPILPQVTSSSLFHSLSDPQWQIIELSSNSSYTIQNFSLLR